MESILPFNTKTEVVVEGLLNNRLGIPIGADDDNTTATIFIPKAGEGLINKEEDILIKKPYS